MKVKFGAIVTNGAGKLGGHQFQRGHTTGHLVTKRTGRKRKDRRPSRQNMLYKEACNSWQRESAQYKKDFTAAWDGNIEVPAKFGDVVELTGFQAYIMRYITYAMGQAQFDNTIFPPERMTKWVLRNGTGSPNYGPTELTVRSETRPTDRLPIFKIGAWNKGQREPTLKEMRFMKISKTNSTNDVFYFTIASTKGLKTAQMKDFNKISLQNWDEVGTKSPPLFTIFEP